MMQSLPDKSKDTRKKVTFGCLTILGMMGFCWGYLFYWLPLYDSLFTMPNSQCQPITYPEGIKITDALPVETFKTHYQMETISYGSIEEVRNFYENHLSPQNSADIDNWFNSQWFTIISSSDSTVITCYQPIGSETVLTGCVYIEESNAKTHIILEFKQDYALGVGCFLLD